MRTILLTGKSGQIGWELQRTLAPLGKIVAFDSKELDLTDIAAIRQKVRQIKPAIIVNAAAYTAVDKAESESDLAMAVNGTAPGVLAEEADRLDAWMIHYSTDYVFDGTKQGGYLEIDEASPQSVYGRTKFEGERAVGAACSKHLILRTSWVYGARGHNFMLTMLRLARERDELRIVDDQVGSPTWCRSIAEVTAQALAQIFSPSNDQGARTSLAGTYHLSSSGSVSWHGFANAIFEIAQTKPMPGLMAIPTSEYPTPARRPTNSVLSNKKFHEAFGLSIGRWQEGLELCLADGAI